MLHAALTGSQAVMYRLQVAFTFLKLSQRSIYSPAEFLKAAKPPWFENGRQQDCSEFLRYLLDTLHEQERNGAGGKAAVVYGEHKIIESSSNGAVASGEEDEVAVKPASLNVIGGGQSAKVSSASNLALDVISEAPENEEKRGGGDEDEEMLSQVLNETEISKKRQ